MIDRSLHPAADGGFVLDRNTMTSGAYGTANNLLGDLIGSAYDGLTKTQREVHFDSGSGFICNKNGLMGYFSWASNDSQYTYAKYTSNSFVSGAIGDSYDSYGGRTFNGPGTTARTSLIADLIPQGLCGAGAYVSEPMVTTATCPNVLFNRYTREFNMAESFYAACPQLYWKTVIIGDPLMAPYATPPEVNVNVDPVLSGVVAVSASASDQCGIKKVDFYFDDYLIASDNTAPYSVELDTTQFSIGPHVIEAIAYENIPIATQSSSKVTVTVDNPISVVGSIREILNYPDGQMVRMEGKVVTAGTNEIGGAFYIEEIDRSCRIKVNSTQEVNRGDVVTIIGALGREHGEKLLSSASIVVTASDVSLPRPMFMRLCDLGGAGLGEQVPAVGCGYGARNTALLVRVVGQVTELGSGWFGIRDGSTDGPVKVMYPGIAGPSLGARVAITGLSTTVTEDGAYQAALRVRNANDIQTLQ